MTGVKRQKRITSGIVNSNSPGFSSVTGQSPLESALVSIPTAGPNGEKRQQADDYPLATNLFRVTKFDLGWFIRTNNLKNMTPLQIVNIQ